MSSEGYESRPKKPAATADSIGPSSWQQVKVLFSELLDLPPDLRKARLAEADEEVRQEVLDLLESHERSGDFLDQPAMGEHSEPEPPKARERLGPYGLLREIGRGGMGRVYLARRDDEVFQKEVAIKLMRPDIPGLSDLHSAEVLRRFRAERQILATLDQPNIARVLDGGTADDGLPYFVMEFVEGLPIDQFCDQQRLGIRARLRLMLEVSAAVEYAHRRLVVHRDLKPSNIVVTEDGIPKLLDFGIAKWLDTETGPGAGEAATAAGVWLLTPEYASPEQVTGEPVAVASDIYSFGVVLYELLTGHRPYVFPSRRPHVITGIICEQEVERPSSMAIKDSRAPVADGGEKEATTTAKKLSQRRGCHPPKLRRQLAGDVDLIVLKALHKEPHRRYGSMREMADDIRNHLEGRPVTARPDSAGYRLTRWIQRNRAVSVIFVLISLFGAATTWQRFEVARERDLARERLVMFERLSELMVEIFEVPDPSRARGETVTAREILDRGADRIRSELDEQPETRARMMDAMGRVYRGLGLNDRSEPLLREALHLRRRYLGSKHEDTADSLVSVANLAVAQGKYQQAIPPMREALAIYRHRFGGDHAHVDTVLSNLARILMLTGDLDGAEALLQERIMRQQSAPTRDELAIARDLLALGNLAHRRGNLLAAEEWLGEGLGHLRRLHGTEHPQTARAMNGLAVVLRQQGRLEEAEPLYQETLEVRRRVLGERHPEALSSLANLAMLRVAQGDLDLAEPMLRETLSLRRQVLEADHPQLASSVGNLGMLLAKRGQTAAAEELMREALEMRRRALPADHPDVAQSLALLGSLLLRLDRLEAAESSLREALDIRREHYSSLSWRVAEVEVLLARCLLRQGDKEAAERLARPAEARLVEQRPGSPEAALAARVLAELESELGT